MSGLLRIFLALVSVSAVAVFEIQLRVDRDNAVLPGRRTDYLSAAQGPTFPAFFVLKDGKRVMLVEDRPGVLGSKASPPADGRVARGYMSASSLDVFHEDPLGRAARRAKSFREFVAIIKKRGYSLEPLRR